MKRYVLSLLAYVAATFTTQATSHFVVNVHHYASVAHLRKEPFFSLGVLTMLIQGGILSWVYGRIAPPGRSIGDAVRFAWLAGAFLVSYIALAEPAKYTVPAVLPWITVEGTAGLVQFTLFGVLLGLVWRGRA